ncbi:phage tail protein [Vibrio parahaemolyticus]|uniref:fibronectin type III domain-containing protein n=1 Tax=Vibrio parahaemolyticus TaxID=670 RepID=UPI0011C88A94|nr:fibronectin type III domain-containing protein [Vibrio parahaemolyticus]TXM33687.1 fibronectin type III domain-containing protein [Vibrio parahaemolyticus]
MGLAAATVAWISVAISVGATIYTMTQMPDNKSNDSIAGTKVTKNGTQSPRNRVYGTAIVGCTYVYSNVLDRDQSYRLDVFSVGGVGAVRFHNVWIDDVKMFDENKNDLTDPANASSGIYDASSMRPRYKKSDGFKMQWRSGQENQVAAKLAIDNSDGEWTVNHRGACVPHIVIFADYSTNQDYVFFSDRYNINALVTGAEVFDPRTGKVDGESSNTALATLDFLMNDYYGMGVTVDYIDMESFKYGATFCEANDLRINSAIDASAKFADILQDMLACCGGALAIVDGKITFLVEEKVLAPVYELDEDSILKNSLKVSPADSGSYYNVVSTTFKSEINRDNDDDFVIPQNAASDPRVMADGKIITKSLKMPYARDAYEAEGGVVQHCVKYMTNLVYNKAKFQMSCSFDIDLHEFSELRPWDVIGVSSEIYGFKNKLFRVQSMKVATDADRFNIATIHCIEYDHSVYEGTVEGTGSLPRPKPDDNVPAPKNVMFTLSSFVNTGYGLLAWEASCFTPSTTYDIEYKLSSASQWTRLTSAFRGTQFTLTDLKEARYDFRVRTYELFLGSSDWTTITNVNVRPAYVIPEVTGLKVETSTPNFKFTWDDMTNVEVDNIPSSDAPNSAGSTGKLADVFHQYSIQIVVNGVMKYATTTKESVFTLDLEKNKEMMGGQPSRVITFRISIEDRLGNSSLVTELVANNRQIGVAGDVDVTNANGSATVEWSPCFEPDFAGTEVHISTTKGFTPSASTLHATLGKESFYVFPFPDKTTRYMRIAHFDTMGRDGLQYSPEITLTYDGVESAKSVRLISDSQTFHVNKSGVAAPSLIIMSAFTQNVEGSVKWTASPSVALATTSNPNERILKYASMGNHDSVKVTVTVDGVTDTMTICKVRDGHDGQDGQDGSNGQDGNTIYEQYRYGQVINPDASWTAWGADMRTSDIYRQTRRVINDVPQAAGRVHRIAGMDGSNGADGERLFVVYHKNPVNQRPMPPEGAGNTGGWTEDSDGANWMSQKLANTIDQPLTFWSFPIQMKGNDGADADYEIVGQMTEEAKNAAIAAADAKVEAAKVFAQSYADGVASEAEKAAIAAADAKANAAETKAKAYADGVVTEAEQAAIAEAERLAAQAEANAKAASDPKGTAAAAQSAAQAYAKAQAEAAELRAKQASDPKGSASAAQQAAIAAADAKVAAAKTAMEAYADGVATDAEQAAIAAANTAANAAEVRAKAYADGEVTKAEQAAIDEAERLAAQAEANAKAASDPKGSAATVKSQAEAYARAQAEAAKDGAISKAEAKTLAEMRKAQRRTLDPFMDNALVHWSGIAEGAPDSITDNWESYSKVSNPIGGQHGGKVLRATNTVNGYTTAVIPVDVTKKYKARLKVRQAVNPSSGTRTLYAGAVTLDKNYRNLTGGAGTHRYFVCSPVTLPSDGSWVTYEGYIQGAGNDTHNFRPNTAYIRLLLLMNYGNNAGGGVVEVDEFSFYEVTDKGDLVDLGFETTQGAQDKANTVKAAAEAYARAQAELAKTQAKAYADGEVTASEARAIAEAQKKADAAKAAAIAASTPREKFSFSAHYHSAVIPLIPYSNGAAGWGESEVMGTLTFRRGGTSASNRTERIDLAVKTAYNNTYVSAVKTATDWNWRFCTFLYNGKKWLGIQAGANVQDARWEFSGTRTCSAQSPVGTYDTRVPFTFIAYRKDGDPSGGNGVLNAEVNNSLDYAVSVTPPKDGGGVQLPNINQGGIIKNLNADNITAGKIAAQYVHADVYNGTLVNATNIKAGMLDADHINTRTFTGENAIFDAEVYGGVLTGAVVRTGSTGARAEMREDGYKFAAYNAQNKPTFYVDANGNVVMNSGSISSDVLSEASRNSNIVTWIGTAGKGGNMQFTDNLALQNDVTYFPITNNYYTTGKNGTLNIQYCAANGYLFQDEKSAVGAAAPAQKTLPADAAPTVYFVDASNTTKGAVIRMTIKYTTQAANGTAPSKSNPSGTQGWRKTYAHFHIDNIATRPNVAAGTNVKGYKLCINVGASSIKTALKALKRVPDVIAYSEVAEGGRYLPHSYKLVWSGAANSVPNSWGSGWYMVQGHDRGDWHDAGFIFVLDENHYGTAAPRSIFPAYSIYYEYRYDTKIFKSSSGNITRIFKLTGV